jgi:polyvinyl alcohol dehydrogenase (cytochrome)
MSLLRLPQTVSRPSKKYTFVILGVLALLILSGIFAGTFLATAASHALNSNATSNSLGYLGASGSVASVSSTDNWVTYHYDNTRDGYTSSLPTITSPAVDWKGTVDGGVYAEPLYYNGNVYVATEDDTVYAFNANTGAISWSSHLGTPVDSLAAPYACSGGHGPDITPVIGITGTPVIDPTTGTLYVAALINIGSNNGEYKLFAINANTGQTMWNNAITAPNFNSLPQEQRSALTLANGLVYVAFGGFSWNCFNPGPTGWVIAMSASGGGEMYAYNLPSRPEGDIWEPEGLSVDSSGNVYVTTGDSNNATFDFGCSLIKLTPDLTFVDSTANYFAPSNWQYLNQNDLDLADTGATLLPGNLIFSIGKYNMGYLLSSTSLGGIGGQLYEAQVCGDVNSAWPYGAWGATSYANGIIYVPCGSGLEALQLQSGSQPWFTSLWNYSGFFAGPPIIAAGAVWTTEITGGTLYALNPTTGAVMSQLSLGSVEHFSTPSAGDGLIFVAATQTIYAINPAPGSSSGGGSGASSVTVNSVNQINGAISGYYTALYQGGSVVASGFTPMTFATTSGLTYSVQVDNYGSCTFAHWSDGVTSNPRSFTATSSSTTFTAVYDCAGVSGGSGGGGTGGASSLTVGSVNQNNSTINGYYTALFDSGGSVVASGFTPKTFSLTSGSIYSVKVDNYGSCNFYQWSDGVTSNPRTFTASGAMTFTAVYNCAGTTGGGGTGGASTVTVASTDQNSNAISGYYTELISSSGGVIASGFTPNTFATTSGLTYSVQVDNYGSCTFAHWSDGVTSNPRSFTATSSSTTFTAVYDCTGTTSGVASSVTVASQDTNNNAITGYRTILYDSSGSVIASGFTPMTFATTSGLTYSVQVDNYGSCSFVFWSNGQTNNPMSFTAMSSATTFTAVYDCGGTTGGGGTSSTVSVNSVDQTGKGISGYYVILKDTSTGVTKTGFTNTTFSTTSGQAYTLQADSYGSCTFNNWASGSTSNPLGFTATSSTQTLTAVYNCGGSGSSPNGITIYDHRIPANYWAPCFATTCTNPLASCNTACTGPGASMYFVLYDSSNNVVATGFANENGHIITGLTPGATYYIVPANCDLCHGSTHDVLFQYFGTAQGTQISTTQRMAVTVGDTVNVWYSCTNGCGGG